MKNEVRLILEENNVLYVVEGFNVVLKLVVLENIMEIVVCLLFMLIYWVKDVCYFFELLYFD